MNKLKKNKFAFLKLWLYLRTQFFHNVHSFYLWPEMVRGFLLKIIPLIFSDL